MKIIITSDLHETPYGGIRKPGNTVERLLNLFSSRRKKTREQTICRIHREIINDCDISCFVHNGDLMECRYNERGLFTEEDLKNYNMIRNKIKPPGSKLNYYYNAGNHETGYRLPLSTDSAGGVCHESLLNFMSITGSGSLYQSYKEGRYLIALLPYFSYDELSDSCSSDHNISSWTKMLSEDLSSGAPLILLLHDPFLLTNDELYEVLLKNGGNIKAVFFGHYHSEIYFKIEKLLSMIYNERLTRPLRVIITKMIKLAASEEAAAKIPAHMKQREFLYSRIKKINGRLIPSPSGFAGGYGGYIIYDTESERIIER